MKYIVPDYYERFSCIAGECKHSCCVGWEIDIDDESFYRYQTIKGAMGEKIRSCISIEGDGPHYILDEHERCPFLRKDGLCEMILELGEDALCQICSDHPRFRNYYEDRVEIGLGLCCEAAGDLIIKNKNNTNLKVLSDNKEKPYENSEEQTLLAFRNMLFEIMQDRDYTIDERLKELEELCGTMNNQPISKWADEYLSLERLDEQWTYCLEKLKSNKEIESNTFKTELWQIAFEQLGVYFLYSHVPDAIEDGDVFSKIAFTVLSIKVLRQLCAIKENETGNVTLDDLVEYAMMYSGEVEYSDENMDILYGLLLL